MPIVEYRLPVSAYPPEQVEDLLARSCRLFADVLDSPLERVRAVVIDVPPEAMCVGGRMVSAGAQAAPYFTFFLLDGRPEEHRHRLLAGFTDLVVECLGTDRALVRGAVTVVAPENWAIAGVPASVARRDEVLARAAEQDPSHRADSAASSGSPWWEHRGMRLGHAVLPGLLAATLLVGSPAAGASNVVDYTGVISTLTRDIPATMAASGVVGLTIALVDGDRVVWTTGFGMADRESSRPVTADTLFHIGSLSKTLTAVAVMQLVEQGRVHLDAPLSTYVPEFRLLPRFRDSEITVRTVLDHHSGVPGDVFNGLITERTPDRQYRSWLLKALPSMYPEHRTNTVYAYSNGGYVLLQSLVENVTGMPFERYAQRSLFGPMGMASSSYDDTATPSARLTRNYSASVDGDGRVAGVQRRPREFVNGWTAGSVTSSARDMAKYMSTLLMGGQADGSSILKSATLERMWTPQVKAPLDISFFRSGLGFAIGDTDLPWAGRVVWHDGSTVWNQSMMKLLPESGLGVFVSVNTLAPGVVSSAVASQALSLAFTAKSGTAQPPVAALPESPEAAYDASAVAVHDGMYASSTSVTRVHASADALQVTDQADLPGAATVDFTPHEDGWFRSRSDPGRQYSFRTVQGRHLMLVRIVVGAGPVTLISGERMPSATLTRPWRSHLGTYRAVNARPNVDPTLVARTLTLRDVDGLLVMQLSSELATQVLRPGPDGVMLTAGLGFALGRAKGDTVRVTSTATLPGSLTYLGVLYERE